MRLGVAILALAPYLAVGSYDPNGFSQLLSQQIDAAIQTVENSGATGSNNGVIAFQQSRGDIADALAPVIRAANTLPPKQSIATSNSLVGGWIGDMIANALAKTLQEASKTAIALLEKSLDDIKTGLLNTIVGDVQNLLNEVGSAVNSILHDIWQNVTTLACAEIDGNVDKLVQFLDDVTHPLDGCTFLDKCCREQGFNAPIDLRGMLKYSPTKYYEVRIA